MHTIASGFIHLENRKDKEDRTFTSLQGPQMCTHQEKEEEERKEGRETAVAVEAGMDEGDGRGKGGGDRKKEGWRREGRAEGGRKEEGEEKLTTSHWCLF